MKRIAVLLLTALMVLALVGCSSEGPKTATDAAVEFLTGVKDDPSSLTSALKFEDERLEPINKFVSQVEYEVVAESDTDKEDVKNVIVRFKGYDVGRYMELYLYSQEASIQMEKFVHQFMSEDGYSEQDRAIMILSYMQNALSEEDTKIFTEYLRKADLQVYNDSMVACRKAGKTYDSGDFPIRVFKNDNKWTVSPLSNHDVLDAMTDQLYTLTKKYAESRGQ